MANCGTAEQSAIRRISRHYDRKCRELSRPRQDVVADTGATPELTVEQAAVNARYRRLDEVRERAVHRLREALATRPTTPQSVGEREAAANFQPARLAPPDAAAGGLGSRRACPPSPPPRAGWSSAGSPSTTPRPRATSDGSACPPTTATSRCWSTG